MTKILARMSIIGMKVKSLRLLDLLYDVTNSKNIVQFCSDE